MTFHELIRLIYGMNSITMIDYKIEDWRDKIEMTDVQRGLLKRIYESNDLDERWAICAQILGHEERARQLFHWIEKKRGR